MPRVDENVAVTQRCRLADGRELAWAEYGDPAGRPLLLQPGTPGSLLTGAAFDEAARRRGWRILALERAGMGESSPLPDASAISASRDAAELLLALAPGPVVSVGISGGATPALALAALQPELVRGAVLVAGMLPLADGFGAGTSRRFRALYVLAATVPRPLSKILGSLLSRAANTFEQLQGTERPRHDVRSVMGRHGALFASDLRRATSQGTRATVRELVYLRAGGEIDWSKVTCRVVAVHGDQDRNVPVVVAHNAARLLPTCDVHILPGRDHFFALDEPDAVLDAAEKVSS